jgi:hypothetical protein
MHSRRAILAVRVPSAEGTLKFSKGNLRSGRYDPPAHPLLSPLGRFMPGGFLLGLQAAAWPPVRGCAPQNLKLSFARMIPNSLSLLPTAGTKTGTGCRGVAMGVNDPTGPLKLS